MNEERRSQRSTCLIATALVAVVALMGLALPVSAADGCGVSELASSTEPLGQPDVGCCDDGATSASHAMSFCGACGIAAALPSFDLPTVSGTDLSVRAPALHPTHAPTALDRPPDALNRV